MTNSNQPDGSAELTITPPGDPLTLSPKELGAAADKLRQLAERHGLALTLVTAPSSEASRQCLAKRHHDVRGAVRTLRFASQALARGYRFADDRAEAKLMAIQKAVATLEQEIPLISRVLEV